jgi:hypothetical protein
VARSGDRPQRCADRPQQTVALFEQTLEPLRVEPDDLCRIAVRIGRLEPNELLAMRCDSRLLAGSLYMFLQTMERSVLEVPRPGFERPQLGTAGAVVGGENSVVTADSMNGGLNYPHQD